MTLERDELALKAALDRRRPAGLPPELLARLDEIPADVVPLRPLPVRLALAAAPWVGLAAAAIVLAVAPGINRPSSGTLPPGTAWSAANPGGVVELGAFSAPWPLLVLVVAATGGLATLWSVSRGEGAFGWLRVRRGGGGINQAPFLAGMAGVLMGVLLTSWLSDALGAHLGPGRDAIAAGLTAAPGPEVTEIQHNGLTFGGDLPWEETTVDHYIYRLRPGEAFTFEASVRNVSPLSITLLGLQAFPEGASEVDWTGLGLLRDPAVQTPAAPNVAPFAPVQLAPGEEVTLVVAGRAGRCADPAGAIPPAKVPIENGFEFNNGPILPLVYEAWGWRLSAWSYVHLQVTIPAREGCP